MGLDAIEMVVRIEKEFDIQIKDSDAEKAITVGDLHDIVWKEVKNKKDHSCLSQLAFYRIRKVFQAELNISYAAFTPTAEMEDIIPLTRRRKMYKLLSAQSGYIFPKLILNKVLATVNTALGLSIFVGALLVICNYYFVKNESFLVWALMIPAIAAILGVNKLFEPLRNRFKTVTVRDFINGILAMNIKAFLENGISRKEMEFLLNNIIVDSIGVDIEEVTPEKNFVKDLGLN